MWFVYMIRCSDGSYYTGITTDLERRLAEHNRGGRRSSAYTRARRPVRLVYRETHAGRSQASRREAELKRLSRSEKERLAGGGAPC